jgi:transcriptional regulator with XRE-family HTH domain
VVTPIVVNTLADRVRTERRSRGLTQTELAAAVGVSTSAISNIETSRRGGEGELIDAIAQALGTTTDYLQNGVKPPKPFEAVGLEIKVIELMRRVPTETHALVLAVLRDFAKFAGSTATKGG